MARLAGIIASKKIGKDSIARELDNNKVANKRCFCDIIGNIRFAILTSYSLPPLRTNSNYKLSIEL